MTYSDVTDAGILPGSKIPAERDDEKGFLPTPFGMIRFQEGFFSRI